MVYLCILNQYFRKIKLKNNIRFCLLIEFMKLCMLNIFSVHMKCEFSGFSLRTSCRHFSEHLRYSLELWWKYSFSGVMLIKPYNDDTINCSKMSISDGERLNRSS